MLELQPEMSLRNQLFTTSQAKKLFSVLAIFLLMTGANIRVKLLKFVPSIQYPVRFNDHPTVQALLNLSSEINAMTLAYVAVLGLCVCPTNVEASKIDGSTLPTHNMVLAIL